LDVQLNGKNKEAQVIIITTQCFAPKIGGIESLMTGMAEAMAKRGVEVLVLADGKTHETDHKQKYKIIRFKGWKPLRRLAKARYLEKICNIRNVEAIYADSWKSIEYLREYKEKILVLAHGTEIPKQYWTLMLDLMRFKKNRIIKSYRGVYKILANSSYTKDLMQASLKIDTSLIKIIHPGIDVYNDFITQEDKKNVANIIGKNTPVITTLARIEERKGHIFILNALPVIKEKFPKVLYLIAGKGPYLNNIKKITKEMNLESNVKFLGWITEPEKSLILKKSDLFVMTPTTVGESVEGFGMAYIDASFHGVASIGSDSGGVSDAIIDGKTGLICESGNQKMITEKIFHLLENKKLRESMGANGKLRANENYAWDKKIIEYLNASNYVN
jgi:phosphatidylinositol alpha-1,6-mannosyltransferase